MIEQLPSMLLAAAPVVAVRVVGAVGRPRLPPAVVDGALALSIAAGLMWALHASRVRPAFPLGASSSAWEWVFWFAPAGALLGLAEGFVRGPSERVRLGIRLVVGAGAAWLILADVAPQWLDGAARAQRVALAAGVLAGLWTVLRGATTPHARRVVAASTPSALLGGAVVLLRVGRAGVMAQAMAALAIATAAAAVPGSRAGALRVPRAAAPLLALVVGGLTVAGFPMAVEGGRADFRLATAVLLAAAPAAGRLVPSRVGPRLAIGLAALAALGVVCLAWAVSGSPDAFEAAPDGY